MYHQLTAKTIIKYPLLVFINQVTNNLLPQDSYISKSQKQNRYKVCANTSISPPPIANLWDMST